MDSGAIDWTIVSVGIALAGLIDEWGAGDDSGWAFLPGGARRPRGRGV